MNDDDKLKPIESAYIRNEFQWDRMGQVDWALLRNNEDAANRVLANPEKFPRANFAAMKRKATEIALFRAVNFQ